MENYFTVNPRRGPLPEEPGAGRTVTVRAVRVLRVSGSARFVSNDEIELPMPCLRAPSDTTQVGHGKESRGGVLQAHREREQPATGGSRPAPRSSPWDSPP